MAYDAVLDGEIQVGDPASQELFGKIKGNLDFLFGQIGSAIQIPNGDFETDSDADGQPDNWTIATHPGGTVQLVTEGANVPLEGANSLEFIHPGGASNGGGTAESDFIPVFGGQVLNISFILKSTAAGTKVNVTAKYWDKDEVTISSDSVVYTSTSNPTSAKLFTVPDTAPSTAKFVTIELEGGATDTDVAGTVTFDRIRIDHIPILRGVTFTTTTAWTTAQATYNIPDSVTTVGVIAASGGGGGGGGAGGNGVTNGGGGGGGAPGGMTFGFGTPTGSITVGAGGTGGAGGAYTVNGTNGGTGGTSSFAGVSIAGGALGAGGISGGAGGAGGTNGVQGIFKITSLLAGSAGAAGSAGGAAGAGTSSDIGGGGGAGGAGGTSVGAGAAGTAGTAGQVIVFWVA